MNRAQDSRRPAFNVRNMFSKMLPKCSSMPSEIAAVLDNFEASLALRIQKLKPSSNEGFLQLSWMTVAVEQLSLIHTDVENLSVALDHPVRDWKDKWMHAYLEDSAKMLEILNPLISQTKMLEQSQRYLACALHNLREGSPEALIKARFSLDKWTGEIGSKDPSLQRCSTVLDGFLQTLNLPKTSDHKENVVMRAMYGFKGVAIFVFSVFAAVFSGSVEKVMDVKVSESHLWADVFVDLQASLNVSWSGNVAVIREVKAVAECINNVYSILGDGVSGGAEGDCLEKAAYDLGESAERFSQGFALLSKEADRLFKAILAGRNTLMGRAQHCLFPRGER